MNIDSIQSHASTAPGSGGEAPILLVPYMWLGDFVRCHTAVKLLNQQFPGRPVDVLANRNLAPLVDYMPGTRKGIPADLPRKQIAFTEHRELARRLRQEGYGHALVMPRTWKAALAPYLADIPRRTGFVGELRFGLLNDLRWGERTLPRMVDRCAMLTLPPGASMPAEWPRPELVLPAGQLAAWRQRLGLTDGRPVVTLAPGAVGPSKRWPADAYAELARRLGAQGAQVWILGGPDEKLLAAEVAGQGDARDLTGADLHNAVLALAAADVAVSNDSGLLHVAAALGTPAIGIFGPTSPWHWAPLNPLAAAVQAEIDLPCRPCHKPTCRLGHHLCMRNLPVERLFALTVDALGAAKPKPA